MSKPSSGGPSRHGKPNTARTDTPCRRQCTDGISSRILKGTWRRWHRAGWIFEPTQNAETIAFARPPPRYEEPGCAFRWENPVIGPMTRGMVKGLNNTNAVLKPLIAEERLKVQRADPNYAGGTIVTMPITGEPHCQEPKGGWKIPSGPPTYSREEIDAAIQKYGGKKD